MRVKLEPETAFIGKKFAYIFLGIIFSLKSTYSNFCIPNMIKSNCLK